MQDDTIYIKAELSIEVSKRSVLLEDIVSIYAQQKEIVNTLNREVFYTFEGKNPERKIFSIFKVMEVIQRLYPKNIIRQTQVTFTYSSHLDFTFFS